MTRRLPAFLTTAFFLLLTGTLTGLVGALAATISLRGSLVGYGMAATVGGALFGMVAGFAVSRQPQSA